MICSTTVNNDLNSRPLHLESYTVRLCHCVPHGKLLTNTLKGGIFQLLIANKLNLSSLVISAYGGCVIHVSSRFIIVAQDRSLNLLI